MTAQTIPADWTPRIGNVTLIMHTVATGGVIDVNGRACCRLTPIQFALLQLLARQILEDENKPESVRGFVSSDILLASLPWHTAHPDLGHLKQLVRRVRRRVAKTGIQLQSWSGLGYRVLVPSSVGACSDPHRPAS